MGLVHNQSNLVHGETALPSFTAASSGQQGQISLSSSMPESMQPETLW